jgi:hypothetical protein
MTDYIYSIYAVKFYIKDKKKFKRLPSAFIITALFFLNGCAHINYPGISTRDYENPVRISTESTYSVHWTEDLLEHLRRLDLKSFQLHWGVAHHGETWRVEHSSVVITAKGQDFEDGIVLDPWRHSGNLYWSLVKKDRYPWRKFGPE